MALPGSWRPSAATDAGRHNTAGERSMTANDKSKRDETKDFNMEFGSASEPALTRAGLLNHPSTGPFEERMYKLSAASLDSTFFWVVGSAPLLGAIDEAFIVEDNEPDAARLFIDPAELSAIYNQQIARLTKEIKSSKSQFAKFKKSSNATIAALERRVESLKLDKKIVQEEYASADDHAKELFDEVKYLRGRNLLTRLRNLFIS